MSSFSAIKTDPLYQKNGQLYTHTSTISSIDRLSDLPQDLQSLFKPPPETTPHVLTTQSTIFHAQGGGQPSDTGTMTSPDSKTTFHVHQVRKVDSAILHMGAFKPADMTFNPTQTTSAAPEEAPQNQQQQVEQHIDVPKRILHSRLHTAGHVIGIAVNQLSKNAAHPSIPSTLTDGKASHYPSAAFVEFNGLIPGTAKDAIQDAVNALVAQDLAVQIDVWSEERAKVECTGGMEGCKADEAGVRVVKIGETGSYPCGGTHVLRLKECGEVLVRGIKRQKGVSKVSYEVR